MGDSNGILNVSACEKAGGKTQKITITNDKGRLSKEEIEKMVQDAEKFKAEDDVQKQRVDSKNSLESYCFQIKSTMDEPNLKNKVSESDRTQVMNKVNEAISWLDRNQMAETEKFKDKQKELESVVNPVMQKLYSQGVPTPGQANGPQTNGSSGPTVEEVD